MSFAARRVAPLFSFGSAMALRAAFTSQRRGISSGTAFAFRKDLAPVSPFAQIQGSANCAFQSLAFTQACASPDKPGYMRDIMDSIGASSSTSLDDNDIDDRERAQSTLRSGVRHLKWGVPTIDEIDDCVTRFGGARLKGLGLTAPGTRFALTSFHCVVVSKVVEIDGKKYFLLYDPEGKPSVSQCESLLASIGPKSAADYEDSDFVKADRVKDLFRFESADVFLSGFKPRVGVIDALKCLFDGDRDGMSAVTKPAT